MNEAQRQEYLRAMGIQNWIPRSAVAEAESIGPDNMEPKMIESAHVEPDSIGRAAAPERRTPPPPATLSPPRPVVRAEPPPSAADEPPSWLDEVPPPADEYLPAVDQGDHADRFGDADLMDDGVSRLDWAGLEARVAHCEACELHKSRTRTVFGVGRRDADLMIIGEAPGADEDRKGEPFVGRAGQLLNAMLKAIGLGREQVYIANILKCRPPGNRDPRAEEALQCAPYLQRQVALVKPRVILAVGAVAARNLLQRDEAVGRLRGGQHQFNGIPVVVTYHPAYLLRSPEQKAKAWQDLQKAARLIQ
ncbi:uracil-DNA glycosylase [Sedimenticola hydrogenitrophicus]|uniref:uracil-DNA glycosylase n=1 Tax=Sedimenticola hydrogenitrophicus TaxID=2967975 RepID=UPI0021A336E6|nr:uracil-DNA glycosylase [Sedimenticola hydrogenitrophicus]